MRSNFSRRTPAPPDGVFPSLPARASSGAPEGGEARACLRQSEREVSRADNAGRSEGPECVASSSQDLGWSRPWGAARRRRGKALIAGANGARRITEFEVDDLTCQIGCFVPRGDTRRGQVQSRRLDGAQGAAQGRRLHHLRDGGRHAGARRFRLRGRHAPRSRSVRAFSSAPASAACRASPTPRSSCGTRDRAASAPSLSPGASSTLPRATSRSSIS